MPTKTVPGYTYYIHVDVSHPKGDDLSQHQQKVNKLTRNVCRCICAINEGISEPYSDECYLYDQRILLFSID